MPEPESPVDIELRSELGEPEFQLVRELFVDYQTDIGIDLSFQQFDDELECLPGDYAEPGGALLLALVDGVPAGCVAFRPMPNSDYPNACEMKRLFVRRAFRGFGLGKMLVDDIMTRAMQSGYSTMLLDTLRDMESARALYQEVGFVEVPPYYHNPLAGAHYLKVDLAQVI
ncbi:GNAT family N-acetyltransferase [Hydrogenophaga sp. 5NK40-0174]|uniref:GNAT family N-acetyltransferase n=1 Tax=Hydrogenophaga sp. 5NK40-0174 TaxID=3127649 RepID=UPI0031055804